MLATFRRQIVPAAVFLGFASSLAGAPAIAQDAWGEGGLSVDLVCAEDILLGVPEGGNCQLNLSGYDPAAGELTVLIPFAVKESDEGVATPNGVLLSELAGEREPDQGEAGQHTLWFSVFACEPPPFGGEECAGTYATPGYVSVPIFIQQFGKPDILYEMIFDIDPAPAYRKQTPNRIGNRGKPGLFIEDDPDSEAELRGSPLRPNSVWYLEEKSEGTFIRNAANTNFYLAVAEDGSVVIANGPYPEVAAWRVTPAADAPYMIIQHVTTGHYLTASGGPGEEKLELVEIVASKNDEWWLLH